MNPRLFLFLFLLLQASFASGQSYRFEGFVRDSLGQGIPYCTVSVLTASDSVVVTGTSSDDSGRYALQLQRRDGYLLRYEHLAYDTETRPLAVSDAEPLPDVVLRPSSHTLDEVVVAAQYTKYRAGRYECNLLGSPLVRNRTVMQLLDLLPGLRASDNSLSIKGSPVAVIYIDDRRVTDLSELSALRAEDIKSVEVENKAGVAYSALTSGGVIRIRLKKLSAGSFYGNVSTSASVSRDGYATNLSVPFATQVGRLGIYNYVKGNYGENKTLDRTHSEFRNSGYALDSEDRGNTSFRSIHELLSLVYNANDRHSIGLGGQIFMGASDPTNTVGTTASELAWGAVPPQMPEAGYTYYRYGGSLYNRQYQASLNYTFRFDSLASKLTFKAGYLHQNVTRNYDYETRDYLAPEDSDPFSTELRHEHYNLLGHSLAARLDLHKNFSDERGLIAGLSYDLHHADNDAPVHRFEDGSWQLDPQSSIWFVDRTQSSGAYTRWADMYGKFTYLVGLRLQWDRITYRNAEDTGYKHRNYWRLFPELSLSYTFNEEKGTNLNLDLYRSSGGLPGNNDLSPRRVWQSQYSYTVGNENLEPGWGYDIDLSYTLRNKLTLDYGFSWSRGSTAMVFYDSDDPNIVYTMEVNGLRAKSQYLAIDYATSITKWFRIDAFMNVYWTQKEVKGDKLASYSTEGGNGLLRLIFQPLSTMEVWVMATVDLPYKGLETRQNGSFSLSAGASKSLCNGKLLLTLNLHPIYYSKLKQTTKRLDESYYSVLRQPRGQRSFRAEFSLSYRFNRNAKKSVSTVQSMQGTQEILK